jgi:PAS domain S-box-containing protein/putative nucleotidyltransferase with HDIG domain
MEKPIRVLVIDDSEDDALLVIRQLKSGGFNPTYEQVDTPEAMSKALDNKSWDIVLCDYSMPRFSASAALELYQEKRLDIPFIIVSGAIPDETAVAAMRAGAHDYIIKNNLARLSPAVDRELREAKIRQERSQAADKLRRSEERYRTLFEDSKDAIYINDAEGDLVDFNQSTMDLLGYSKEDLIGMDTKAVFVNTDQYDTLQEELAQAGSVKDFEARLRNKDGSEMDCLITSTVRKTRDNNILGYQGIIRDITELMGGRKKLEKALGKLGKALRGTIQAMAITVETRDPYTAGHQRRVTRLAIAIAIEIGLSEDQIQGISLAGLIHDIGKISVPGEILSKPGAMSENELSIIRDHAKVGHDILKPIDFPWPIARIVQQHHERMDGTGYPGGISGEDILIEARIMAVADVVEAMASHRPYRPALGIDVALEEISKNRGLLYDSKVVDACLELIKNKGYQLEG